MKRGFVKSSPHFFRPVKVAAIRFVALLLTLAALVPAPLQEPANPALTPNPAKSAWFLLWIQETVSWSRLAIYPLLAGCFLFLALPWLPGSGRVHRGEWFPRQQRLVSLLTMVACAAILALTLLAMFFRGANWSLSF